MSAFSCSAPCRCGLSKYSYLTQSAIPTLVGAICIGPSPVVAALWVGVVGADVFCFASSRGPELSMPDAK